MSKAGITKSNGFLVLMVISLVLAFMLVPVVLAQAETGGVVAGEGYDGVRRIYGDNGEVLLELEPDELFIFTMNSKILEKSKPAREKLIGQYIREKFPNLKFRIVDWDENGIRETHFERSGVYPDLWFNLVANVTADKNTMFIDLTELVEKYNFDLSRISEACMAIVYDRGMGQVLAIPFQINDYILFYNKTIFDKKGISYPYAGMTYNEAYEKAKALTFGEDITMYKGYAQHPDFYLQQNQLGLVPWSLTEPNKIVLNTPEWVELVNNLTRFYQIRGNKWNSTDDFFVLGTAAMCVDTIERLLQVTLHPEYVSSGDIQEWQRRFAQNGLQPGTWDIEPIPQLKEGDESTYIPNVLGWFITEHSKMKETAFQVIMHLLSDEVQLARSKDGIKGVLNNPELAEYYGVNIPELQGLNLSAVYWGKNAVIPVRDPEVVGYTYWKVDLWKVFRQYVLQDGYPPDLALKRVENEHNQAIQEQLGQ